MAAHVLKLQFDWENDVSVKRISQLDGGDVMTIVDCDENNHITDIWPHMENICKIYFQKKLTEIGDEMKTEA